nr:PREDICTED: TSC22 domain family protein 1 [Lepisosteus oculatus]
MHHPESAGDSASTRKMAHPAIFPRRGSSTGSGNISALAAAAGSSISNNVIPPDDYQSPLLIQPPPPAGSSSPVPQHPPQSLNLLSQSQLQAQPLQSAGAQMKKKSGFQITSVTPAQISVSTNNSIAEDTESYDDLDESHTEDLSSSEILDVSLSRATDLGGPERSSSEETLNNFHEAETPGAVSPNQPHLPSAPPHHQLLSQQQQQVAPPAAASSRFRVVKLDSSSEPFRKGRWTCTEYYDKEAAAPAAPPSDGPPGHRLVESLRQTAPESAVGSERESTSGSSVSSTVSTLSHYTESVGSGEVGAPCVLQAFQQQPPQPADYSGPPGMQCSLPGLPQSGSQPQLAQAHVHAQDVVHSLLKTSGAPSIPVSIGAIQQQAPIGPMQGSVGHPGAALPQQQLPYSQKAGQPAPAGVAPQQMGFPAPQPSAAPTQMPPAHAMPVSQGAGLPPDFVPHQPLLQTPVPPGPQQQQQQPQPTMPPLPHISGAMPPAAVTGNSQMMAAGQQQQPGGGGSGGTVPAAVGQPPLQGILQQSTPSPPQMAQTAQGGILPQVLPAGVSGLAQQLAKAHPQPPGLLQPQTQLSVEQQQQPPPLAPGLAGQQPAGIAVSQVAANVPPSLPQPSMAQSAAQPVQNGSVLASLSQAPVMPAGVGLPIGQGALPPATSQYPNLPPLTAAQLEDARRFLLQEQSLLSLPKLAAGECASEAGTSLAHDPSGGINALAASATLLPLKTLPLATHVVDGEDDSSSGASVVAIDNKIEQAMDLVKSHLMYAVREEVEVLKEQIKELIERNSQLEQENNLLKNLASPEQLAQFQAQLQSGSPPASSQPPGTAAQQAGAPAQPASQSAGPSA